jgi:hypothetical protein
MIKQISYGEVQSQEFESKGNGRYRVEISDLHTVKINNV